MKMHLRPTGPWLATAGLIAVIAQVPVFAQDPGRAAGAQGQRAGRQGGRAQLPPPTSNPDQAQVQAFLDTYAIMQAERELQLSSEQYPTFVQRLRRLHEIRRRMLGERRRALNELRGLMTAPGSARPRDEAVDEKVRALDEVTKRGLDEVAAAVAEIDAGLTPWQRARFRLLEERLERQKIDMLIKLAPAGGGRGRGGQ